MYPIIIRTEVRIVFAITIAAYFESHASEKLSLAQALATPVATTAIAAHNAK